jgi:hypothetical protein
MLAPHQNPGRAEREQTTNQERKQRRVIEFYSQDIHSRFAARRVVQKYRCLHELR